MITQLKNLINKILFKLGYRISKTNNTNELVKIYKYKDYEEYKETQIFYNKKKINHVWADELTLGKVANFITKNIKKDEIKGICHGSRNGFEQSFFNKNILNSSIIGTDISETATNYKNSVVWDFHKVKDEWVNYYDFVYSNSLDQSFDPKTALTSWIGQINKGGYIII